MKFALVQNGVVASVIEAEPGFTIAGQTLVACSDSVRRGDLCDGTSFVSATPVAVLPTFAPSDFQNLFTQAEQLGIAASNDPQVRLAIVTLGTVSQVSLTDPLTIQYVNYLASINLITSDRASTVLAGGSPS